MDLKQLLDEALLLKEREITEDTKLFFVGTTESKYDLASQKFKDYKELDKISIENAAFGTSTWGYACAYAKQYAKKDDHGVVVAFELKPGLEVFDVRNPAEYDAIGIPREIANVFVDAEPYFAINTKVPAQQAGVRPPEFTAALSWLKDAVEAKKENDNILDWLRRLDDHMIPSSRAELATQWSFLYSRMLEQVFRKFLGEKGWLEHEATLKSHRFNDITELIDLGAHQVYTPEMHAIRLKRDKLRAEFLKQKFGKKVVKIEDGSELQKEFFKYLLANGVPGSRNDSNIPLDLTTGHSSTYPTNVFRSRVPISLEELPASEWKYRFKGMSEPQVVPNLESLPQEVQILAHNCNLLYKNPKGSGGEEDDEETQPKIALSEKVLDKIFGYLKLFQVCKDHILSMESGSQAGGGAASTQAKKFRTGIARIKKRLKKDSKHIYIDYLQFVFFSLLMQSDRYIGVTCPEIRGYAHIHRLSGKDIGKEKFPYGYSSKISTSTLYYDDMTVILCKSLAGAIQKTFGHTIDFIDAKDYRKTLQLDPPKKRGRRPKGYVEPEPENQLNAEQFREIILPDIQKCNSVDSYKAIYKRDLEAYLSTKNHSN